MDFKRGIAVSSGVVIGPALVLDAEEYRIPRRVIRPAEVRHEREVLDKAVRSSLEEITELRDNAAARMGREAADIFDFHLKTLKDPKLHRQFADVISGRHYAAAYAVSVVMQRYEKNLSEVPDPYFAERVKDIYDIKKRLLRHVLGEEREDLAHLREDVIVVAHDLTPGQVAQLEGSKVRGFAIDAGGRTGHAAIIARSMGLPGIVGLGDASKAVSGGDLLILDGHHGLLVIDPDEDTIAKYREQEKKLAEFTASLETVAPLPSVTADGQRITLLANIEAPHEVHQAISKGAEGIGLYRTEYAYLQSNVLPTEEELYDAYSTSVREAGGKPVVIRTMDLGGDRVPQINWPVESNPFLGCRSIRFCLQNIELFKTQLRAILRASVEGDLRIMFPMITSLIEVRQAKSVVNHVMEDLTEQGIAFNKQLKIGIMVETPAAALCAHTLAAEVDFFSIGTNDLTQYTLAVDRGNERVANLFTPAHPAVLQLIREVIRVGKQTGVEVSVCGEMAGEPDFALLLLGMGLTVFSMSLAALPEIKTIIRMVNAADAVQIARKALSFETERQVLNYLRDETRKLLPEAVA